MALVPESWLHRNFQDDSTCAKPSLAAPTEVTVHDDATSRTNMDSIPDLLPKCYRAKAKIIVHYLRAKITLDENQRIVYPDKSVGSHILTLLRYFVSPFVKERPLDAPKFRKLMKEVGVPDYVYAKENKNNAISNWKIL